MQAYQYIYIIIYIYISLHWSILTNISQKIKPSPEFKYSTTEHEILMDEISVFMFHVLLNFSSGLDTQPWPFIFQYFPFFWNQWSLFFLGGGILLHAGVVNSQGSLTHSPSRLHLVPKVALVAWWRTPHTGLATVRRCAWRWGAKPRGIMTCFVGHSWVDLQIHEILEILEYTSQANWVGKG